MNTFKTMILVASLSLVALSGCGDKAGKGDADGGQADSVASKEKAPVQVDLYVMSKCPYGVQAVEVFGPVMDALNGAVDLNLEYIGTEDAAGKMVTMHGESELVGNAAQLCAGKIAPEKQLAYVNCMNKEWRSIPKNWESCAKETGIDPGDLGKCKNGAEGKKLLSETFARAKEAKAAGSPTIRINGEDYQGARSPRDIIAHICDKFGEKENLKQCHELPPPPKVLVTGITDKRCGEECNLEPIFKSLTQALAGLETKVAYWNDPETQKLCKELGIEQLPAIVFDESLKNDPSGLSQLERWLVHKGKYTLLKIKPEFDPNAEICDNGSDDTGNGKVDCDDDDCTYSIKCREETKRKLEVFIMSQCPYGMVAVKSMKEILDAFGKDINFEVHYIAEKTESGLDSMHGPNEIAEDIRMLCAAKHYPRGHKYLEYIWCRGADVRDQDWKKCTGSETGIKAEVIEKCVETEGAKLLEEDAKIASGLSIGASPTWMVNGTTQFGGLLPHAIQQSYCEKNGGLEGCGKKLSGGDDGHNHGGGGHGGGGMGPGGMPAGLLPQGPNARPGGDHAGHNHGNEGSCGGN